MNKKLKLAVVVAAFTVGFYAIVAWAVFYPNESVGLPEQAAEPTISWKVYTFSITRNTGASATYDTGIDIPSNCIIRDVMIDVITAWSPVTNTVAIQCNTGNDLLSASTNLQYAGITNGIPVSSDITTAVKATADRDLSVVLAGTSAATQGVFKMFLECYQSQ